MTFLLQLTSTIIFSIGAVLMTRTPDIGSNLPLFCLGFILTASGYIGLINFGLPGRNLRWWAWLVLLVLGSRLLAMNLHPSDDIARYIWEGRLIREGFSPYSVKPDDPRLERLRDDVIYPMINHKDMPAIYPPLTHYTFALLTYITDDFNGFRLFIIIMELAAIGVMMLWLKLKQLSLNRIMIYALNPLVIIGIAGHGHLDSIQILLLICGIYAWSRQHRGAAITLVTLAGLVKFLGLFALPFLINRRTVRFLPISIIIISGSYLPFIYLEGGLSPGNLGVYLGQFEYYSLTFAPLRWMFGTVGANIVTAAILGISLFWLWMTRTRPEHAVAPFLMIVTLMSTTIHYWYLMPLLALSVFWRNRALIGLSLLFLPYFFVFRGFAQTGEWVGQPWWQVATYTGFLIILVVELTGRWPTFSRRLPGMGIIIPVLNDAEHLKRLLASLSLARIKPRDVVIADGGSRDDSVTVAEEWGAQVVLCSRKGRGNQVAEAITELRHDLVLILHADVDVPPDIGRIRRVAAAYPEAPGGACSLDYAKAGAGLRLLSILSTARVALFGLSFGDQGQWIRRKKVSFPPIPLMEDVELAVRMNDVARVVWTPVRLTVSLRRYEDFGSINVIYTTLRRMWSYMFKRHWTESIPDTEKLFKEYYSVKRSL